MQNDKSNLNELITTVRTLRGPSGCPWDRKQTTFSMVKYLKSEFEELLQAIDNEDYPNICEELGDLLFILVMIAEIEHENDRFSFSDIVRGINEKLIRRHPHVFADAEIGSEKELREQWNKIKEMEKQQK